MCLSASIGSSSSPELPARKRKSTKANNFVFKGTRRLQIEALALSAVLCILFSTVSLHAATYTVKAGGGGNYATIQACATAMAAGDICTVYAGTYNENVNVSSGTAGNLKTLTVNSGDTVYVESFTIGSHVKVNGFHIQNPSSPTAHPCVTVNGGSTDYYVTNNNMYACNEAVRESSGSNTTYGYITGNTISYMCSTSSSPNVCLTMSINGDYHLIEKNNISHVSDGPYVFGRHNVLRKNSFHDVYSTDCGSNSSNCHIDFMQADADVPATQPAQYLLIEGNTIENMIGNNMHSIGLFQAESCSGQCYYGIVRFNTAAHIGGGGIVDDNSLITSTPGWSYVKDYNNTWADVGNQITGGGNGISGFTHGSTNGSTINDLFYFPFSLSNWNPYFTDASSAPFSAGHNLAFCTIAPCAIYAHVYGSGSWTTDPGNIMADPKFVSYAANNFGLSAGSPALGAGTYLTTVAPGDSGSGTSLVVTDATFFQAGNPLSGVQSDCIAVTTATNHFCVTTVNYSTNTLTLASSFTRSPGDPVWLYSDSSGDQVLSGNAPNIGASFGGTQNSGQTPPPPTGVINNIVIQ